MVEFLMALALMFRVEYGHAAHYNRGIMERVIRVRQAGWTAGDLPIDLPPVVGFIATADCHEIGQLVYVYHKSEGLRGPYLIADCANRLEGHDKRMRRLNILCDVDYNTAKRWGVIGRSPDNIFVAIVRKRPHH